MADKRKYHRFITPKATFRYPKILKPDYGTKEFPKPHGEYSVQAVFRLDDPAFQKMLAQLQVLHDQAVARGREEFSKLKVDQRKKLGKITVNPLYTVLYDQDTEEETGEVMMKFSCRHSFKDKKTEETRLLSPPDVFDAFKKPVKNVDPWSGTTGKVAFSVEDGGYFIPSDGKVGISMRLSAVQIIDLVEGGQRSADSYGFDEEDGFDGSGRDEVSENDADEDTDEDDGSADF